MNIKIAYKTRNSTGSYLKTKHLKLNKYSASGIYKLSCPDCNKPYIGQTERSFSQRFKEHHLSFRTNNTNSSFTQHLLENSHILDPQTK
jgi:hypothetical protein